MSFRHSKSNNSSSSNNPYVDLDDYYGSSVSGGSCAYIVLNPRNLKDCDPTKRFRGSVTSITNDGLRGGTPNSSIDLEWEVDGMDFYKAVMLFQ